MTSTSPRRPIRTVEGGRTWLKASYSGTNGGNCVEVTPGFVRDSKNPQGDWLPFSAVSWRRFLESVTDA
ncbi:DUF397 domain-containing protein [Lentzea sp. NBRC 102530]|uniref:DUF397 domain-containing protein n=1 Tax=Lentzea sp. NBRC 102530 TaxID=3032201 RepID=UPI0024A4F0F2|nr:DUF397 domain-containing protein [Lentzea sp. NBRC 102530]GLY54809.1 hypothetical protein Lesp01_84640 [Lentzea sp. NBRC 102530]